ncbi:hypothetical protein [Microbacterium sp. WCS2018Hpa-9]|uniref:hypothetical protein n=1 Tax=Microbacterium sp. WCS2018Hpa-9 TaxID=3073635 RepID=UPI00288A8242|nr:hypothetical protein [Microbacterium sp. WCS2018Hpa-9]
MRVEPVSEYPPATSRTLAEWLDADLAALHGTESRSRLREIADARAMRRAMWASFLALGSSSVILGLVLLAVGVPPSAHVPLMIVGGVIAVASGLFFGRVRGWLPRPGTSYTTRGAGALGGGLIAAASIFGAINVFLIPGIVSSVDPVPLLALDAGLALVLVSVFVIPAAIIGRGRHTLRREAARNQRLAAALDHDRVTWGPGVAVPMFGPL